MRNAWFFFFVLLTFIERYHKTDRFLFSQKYLIKYPFWETILIDNNKKFDYTTIC